MSEAITPGYAGHVPAPRSLEAVLRDALASPSELKVIPAITVDGGNLFGLPQCYGHVSINGSPPILIVGLGNSLPRTSPGGNWWTTSPGQIVYVLVIGQGQMIALGYLETYIQESLMDEPHPDQLRLEEVTDRADDA